MKPQAQEDPSFISTSRWALAIVAGVAVAITAGWQLAGPGELKRQLAQAENNLRTSQAEIARLKKELAQKPVFSNPQNFPPAQENAVVAASHAGEKPFTPAAPMPAEAFGKSLRKMLEAPGMKAAMKQQQAFQITQRYGHLFDVFSFNDQEKQAFNQLLDDRVSAQSEFGLKMMDTSMTSDQRQQASAAYQTAKQASDAAIKSFLNSDGDYQTFQQWEDTSPERMQMQFMGDSLFASSPEPLTPQQQQQLIDTMYQARKQSGPAAGQDPSNPANFDPSNFNDAALQKALQSADANAQIVAQNAKSFLTPGQLQTLANMQSQMRSMTESSMKMAQTMFGGKSQ